MDPSNWSSEKAFIRKRREIICQCNSICITLSKKYDPANDSHNPAIEKFLQGEHAYIIRPQSIEVASMDDCEIRVQYDSCFQLICKSCSFTFKIVPCGSYAIITEPRYSHDLEISDASLITDFPFQLRPFIIMMKTSKSSPSFTQQENVEEDSEEYILYPYALNQEDDDILSNELIVGNIPSGFLVF